MTSVWRIAHHTRACSDAFVKVSCASHQDRVCTVVRVMTVLIIMFDKLWNTFQMSMNVDLMALRNTIACSDTKDSCLLLLCFTYEYRM
jgi:hypothetical protein